MLEWKTHKVFVGLNLILVLTKDNELKVGGYTYTKLGLEPQMEKTERIEKRDLQTASKMKTLQFPKNEIIRSICCKNSKHVLFVTENDKLYGMGERTYGCLGENDWRPQKEIKPIPFFINKKVKEAFTVTFGSFVLLKSNELYVFGMNIKQKLGYVGNHSSPIHLLDTSFLEKNERIIDIQGGAFFSIMLTSSGNVYSVGNSICGDPEYGHKQNFTRMKYFESKNIKIKAISVGFFHVLFLTKTNRVYSVGKNQFGQLGIGNVMNRNTPSLIKELHDIKKIEAGTNQSFFIDKKMQIYCCGDNRSYSLGLNHNKIILNPKIIIFQQKIKYVDVFASYCSYFISENGNIHSVGSNIKSDCVVGSLEHPIKNPKIIKDTVITLESN